MGTGSECCMQGDYNCTTGDEATCTGVWTGSSCCKEKNENAPRRLDNCVAGDATSCKGQWTGDMCCFEGDWLCFSAASVNSSTCSGSWTGSECCMQGDYNCTTGDEATCSGVWTGSSCCKEKNEMLPGGLTIVLLVMLRHARGSGQVTCAVL